MNRALPPGDCGNRKADPEWAPGSPGTLPRAFGLVGRKSRLMEIDPKYAQVIVVRWQQYSGKCATLDGDGRTFDEVAQQRRQESAFRAAAHLRTV